MTSRYRFGRTLVAALLLTSPLTAAPQHGHNCLDALDGAPQCAVFVDSEGGVGIGTQTPEALLHIEGSHFVQGAEGDFDGNGVINADDILEILDFVGGVKPLTPANFARHDVNGDGRVSIDDVGMVIQLFSGITKLEAKQAIEAGYGMADANTFDVGADLRLRGSATVSGPLNADAGIRVTADSTLLGNLLMAGTLQVFGPIEQHGVVIHPDFVFEPGYELETIEEHAEHMWEHKHLKAVPKARQDEQGREVIEIAEHRAGMLEELEKAHIYIAQLNERLREQEEELEGLHALAERIENLENTCGEDLAR
jgi:hypothetical protein